MSIKGPLMLSQGLQMHCQWEEERRILFIHFKRMHSFLQRSGFHTGPLVPVTFRSTVVFGLLLENAGELFSNRDGARLEVSFPVWWLMEDLRCQKFVKAA